MNPNDRNHQQLMSCRPISSLLIGMMFAVACGSNTALDTTRVGGQSGSDASEGGTGGVAGAEDGEAKDSPEGAELPDASGPIPETLPGVCTPGLDQTCNDDPTVSTVLGMCRADASCKCWYPSAANPATGRCLAIDKCSNFPVGDWPYMVSVDVSDCKNRPFFPCSEMAPTGFVLTWALSTLIRQSCTWPSYEYVRAEFVDGCATRVSARSMSTRSLQPLVDCAAKALSTVRVDCAEGVQCATVEHDTLP